MAGNERLMVSAYRPDRRRQWLLLIIGLVVASFFIGLVSGGRWFESSMVEKRQLQRDFDALQQEQQQLQQRLANAELTSEVDRNALESVRLELSTLQGNLSDAQDELSFYRNLLQQEGAAQGLIISAFSLTTNDTGGFGYRMVVQQRAGKLKKIKVTAAVKVVGMFEGVETLLKLTDLDPELEKASLSLQFRYFYIHDGTLMLPEGFEPQVVRVKVWPAGQKKKAIEREFEWQVEEF